VTSNLDIPVFVSLTTIKARLVTLAQVLESIVNQTRPPDRIIINFSSEPFLLDPGFVFQEFPESIRRMYASNKIEIYRVPNQGSYRKLLPTLRRYSGSKFLIATIDDDIYYPPGWLAGLIDTFNCHQCVAAYRCRVLTFDSAVLLPYRRWPIADPTLKKFRDSAEMINLLPTGRGGILYHADHLRNFTLLEAFRTIAPTQDDLAFRWAAMARRVPVAVADFRSAGAAELEFSEFRYGEDLFKMNAANPERLSKNDHAWNRLAQYCVDHDIIADIAKSLIIS
jgi:glycosyltransferase involved in cell wall biosynthesis